MPKEEVPDKPKRPANLFFRFRSQVMTKVREDNPKASVTEISKIIGQMYAEMSEADKAKMKTDIAEENKVYQVELQKYHDKYGKPEKAKKTKKSEDEESEQPVQRKKGKAEDKESRDKAREKPKDKDKDKKKGKEKEAKAKKPDEVRQDSKPEKKEAKEGKKSAKPDDAKKGKAKK